MHSLSVVNLVFIFSPDFFSWSEKETWLIAMVDGIQSENSASVVFEACCLLELWSPPRWIYNIPFRPVQFPSSHAIPSRIIPSRIIPCHHTLNLAFSSFFSFSSRKEGGGNTLSHVLLLNPELACLIEGLEGLVNVPWFNCSSKSVIHHDEISW